MRRDRGRGSGFDRAARLGRQTLIRARATLLAGALALTLGGAMIACDATVDDTARRCAATIPAPFDDLPRSEATDQKGVVIGAVGRDGSVIVVPVCQPQAAGAPDIRLNGAPPFGLSAVMRSGEATWYLLFAPSESDGVALTMNDDVVGRVRFEAPAPGLRPCGVGSGRLRVEGCGSLVHLRWRTALPVSAHDVAIVDGGCFLADSGEPLGFYLIEVTEASPGLDISFACDLPPGRSPRAIEVRIDGIEVRDGPAIEPRLTDQVIVG